MIFIEARNLPRHVAIIMDGNGRWAEQRGKPRTEGHRAGSKAVQRIVRAVRRLGIPQLTLYAFSEQNWGRPNDEVDALMALLHEFLINERDEILSNDIRLRAIGNTQRLPEHVRAVLDQLSRESSENSQMLLSLALSYGGREEIVDAARTLARQVAQGLIRPEDITEGMLEAHIPSIAHGQPDLMIRTGGELRISNFLLWGSAYSELFFTEALWPDFQTDDLYQAIASYQRRERRYGLVASRHPIPPTVSNGVHPTESTTCPTSP